MVSLGGLVALAIKRATQVKWQIYHIWGKIRVQWAHSPLCQLHDNKSVSRTITEVHRTMKLASGSKQTDTTLVPSKK